MSKEQVVSDAKAVLVAAVSDAQDAAIGAGYDGGFSEGVASVPQNPDVAALNQQISDLQAQVAGMFTADQIHQAVLDEDAKLAAKLKPILDALGQSDAAPASN